MFGRTAKTRCQTVRELAPLRVSDDLSADEMELVDRHVQRCPSCLAELASFERTRSLLADLSVATAQVPGGNPDGAMWARIEPRLGPAGKFRRRRLQWISTPQLAAACLGMFGFTIYNDGVGRFRAAPAMAKSRAVGNASLVGAERGINAGSVGDVRVANGPVGVNPAMRIGGPNVGRSAESTFVPSLGLVLSSSTDVDERFQEREMGPIVVGVVRGWPGSRGDIREGDVIVAVNDRAVFSPVDVDCALRCCDGGSRTILRLMRRGVPYNVAVIWHEMPAPSTGATGDSKPAPRSARESFDRLWLRMSDLP